MGELLELSHQRDHAPGPQRELFDQYQRLVPPSLVLEFAHRLGTLGGAFADHGLEIATVLFDQVVQGPQIRGQPAADLLLGQLFGKRNFDRTVEGQNTRSDLA